VPNGTDEKFDGIGSDAVDIKGHNSAVVDIDSHKFDAINIDKDLVGDEKDIEIATSDGLVSSKVDPSMEQSTMGADLANRLRPSMSFGRFDAT
jgi:hypothetical protein